jgi:hypothetical protein
MFFSAVVSISSACGSNPEGTQNDDNVEGANSEGFDPEASLNDQDIPFSEARQSMTQEELDLVTPFRKVRRGMTKEVPRSFIWKVGFLGAA